jgi:hypothetical protein
LDDNGEAALTVMDMNSPEAVARRVDVTGEEVRFAIRR